MTRGLADKRVLIVEDEYIVALNIATEVAARGAVIIGWDRGWRARGDQEHASGWLRSSIST
jgi:hypothetical protein